MRSRAKPSRGRRTTRKHKVETSVFELVATAQELTPDDDEVVRLVAQLLADSTVRLARSPRRVAVPPDQQMARLAA